MVLAVVLAGLLSSNVLFTVFVVAIPRVAAGLHTSVATTTWVVTAPMLGVAVFVPLAGKLSDRFGHRLLFLIGMVGNLIVAVLSALAPNIGFLIAARALGGVVGAGLGASSMALVLAMFDKGDRVKAMGWWALVGAGGPVFGVAIGGVLIESIGWRSLFLLEMALGAVALVFALLVLPEHGAGQHRAAVGTRLDWPGAALVITAVGSLLFALNRAPLLGWTSDIVLGSFALSLVAAAVLLVVERRAADPLVPLHYLARASFSFPIASQMLSNFAYIGGFFLAPLMLEQVYGRGESAAGLLVIPRPLSFALIAPLAGYVAVRVGERTAAVVGSTAVVASMAFFAATTQSGGILLVEVGLLLSGIGMGIATPSVAASVANVVDQDALGTASATQQLMVQIATVAGIQVVQTVQESAAGQSGTSLLASFHTAFLVGGAVAVAGVLCALRVRSTVRAPTRAVSDLTAIGVDLARAPSRAESLAGPEAGPVAAGGAGPESGGDVLEALRHVYGAGIGRGRLQRHELGHVPIDADLAGHERLHAGLGVPVHQDRLGRFVVDRHSQVDGVDVAGVEAHVALARVEVGVHRLVPEGRVGDVEVHPDRMRHGPRPPLVLGADPAGLGDPLLAQKGIGGHGERSSSSSCAPGVTPDVPSGSGPGGRPVRQR